MLFVGPLQKTGFPACGAGKPASLYPEPMVVLRAFFYFLAVVLLVLAAFGVGSPRVSLALLGAACFVFAFSLPDLHAAIS